MPYENYFDISNCKWEIFATKFPINEIKQRKKKYLFH